MTRKDAGNLDALPMLGSEHQELYKEEASLPPVKVLQVGEGNFLRGFADWMLHHCNRKGLFNGSIAVTQPRPSGKPHMDQLKAQHGMYTLLVRGLQDGRKVEEREIVSVFSRIIDPYEEWEAFLSLAEGSDLEFVISNTTEAGLIYQPCAWNPKVPILSFPGKLTAFLYRRYQIFEGDPSRGLIHLPCELLDHNGDRLHEIVLRHAEDWQLPEDFKQWITGSNRFLNTLVDRIVTGYPYEEAEALYASWGYSDPLLTTAEPYLLWAIQADDELESRLPLATSGLNVRWVNDLQPYQLLKVRILNGAHTLMATLGLMKGLTQVREAIEHPEWGALFVRGIWVEILPGLPLSRTEAEAYANQTIERFRNPYIKHRLTDIAMNSLSKWKTRLLPSLKAYIVSTAKTPQLLTQSLSALIWLYRPDKDGNEKQLANGISFRPKDNEEMLAAIRDIWSSITIESREELESAVHQILSLKAVWGEDLAALPGLVSAVATYLYDWKENQV